jgi:acetyltransferase
MPKELNPRHGGRPTFGPLMMFGAGGTAVEVLRDTAHALPPLDFNLARDLMRQTRWQAAAGYRDRPAVVPIALPRSGPAQLSGGAPSANPRDRYQSLIADDKGLIA